MHSCTFRNNRAWDDVDSTYDGGKYQSEGGAIHNSGSTIKAMDACTFENNTVEHYGPDIFSSATATTILRDSTFLTPEIDGMQRVIGSILSCDSPSSLMICPQDTLCQDTARTNASYGVKCGVPCSLGFYGIGPDSCTACDRGKYGKAIHARQAEACELCPEGRSNAMYGQPGAESCIACGEGTHATMGAPQCLQVCKSGQEQVSKHSCADCPPGKTSSSNKTKTCIPCSAGSFASRSGSPYCERCPPGKNSNQNRTKCDECQANTFSVGGVSVCTACQSDEGAPPGSSRCYACEPGYEMTSDGFTCRACAIGKERPHTQRTCSQCKPGFIAPNATTAYCTRCPEGTFSSANGTKCNKCPANEYSIGGTASCTKCKLGEGAPPGSSRCFSCEPGYEVAEDGFTCRACPSGKKRPHTQKSCSACDPGSIAPHAKSPYCAPCAAGTYSINATACVKCPVGHFCQRGASTPQPCTDAGSYCPLGSSTPQITKAGYYTNSDRSGISACTPGFYCIEGRKSPCPSGTYGADSYLASSKCSGECLSKDNKYSAPGSTACSCFPTFVNSSAANTDCTCPPGMYKSEDTTPAKCVECPHGLTKTEYGDQKMMCKAPEISTTRILPYAGFGLLALLVIILVYRSKTSRLSDAAGVLLSPVIVSALTLLSEVIDIVGDGITCRNVIRSEGIAERDMYIIMTAIAAFAAFVGLIERIWHLSWQLERHDNKVARKRTTKSTQPEQSSSAAVVPENKAIAHENVDNLRENGADIRSVYMRTIILIFEDLPMLVLNTFIMHKYQIVDTAMLLSLVCSCLLAGAKLRSVAYLRNLYKERARLVKAVEDAATDANDDE